MLKYLAVFLFIFISSIDLIMIVQKQEIRRNYTKPLIIPAIFFFYLQWSTHYQYWLLFALFFSFLGDLLLLFSEKKHYFRGGLFAFLCSHISYCALFISDLSFQSIIHSPLTWSVFLYLFFAGWFLYYLRAYLGHYRLAVLFYSITIMTMSYTSLLRYEMMQGINFWFPWIGTLFFILSDTLLAFRNFKYGQKKGWVSVMATYILAQFFITLGYLF